MIDVPANVRPIPRPAAPPVRPFGLTPRELQVLDLVGHGHTNRQIADELLISVKTAGIHVSHVLAKMDVSRRTQAAILAVRMGLA